GYYQLYLIDSHRDALNGLKHYLEAQLTRYAEKMINPLRKYYSHNRSLIDNVDIIRDFVSGAMDIAHIHTNVHNANDASMVFEAIVEDFDVKTEVFRTLKEICNEDTFFFTNTSSIPIREINKSADLNNRIIGYHFYNPPAIQKLVEVISPENVNSDLHDIAMELGKRLGKTLVPSKDIAGFIGNGHFLREIIFACEKVRELSLDYSQEEAIYIVNQVTQDFMIRPMGTFQLVDYVGLEVFLKIYDVMGKHLDDIDFDCSLIKEMIESGIKGGQNADGSQKNGFFSYDNGRMTGIFKIKSNEYQTLTDDNWQELTKKKLGDLPDGHFPWKTLLKDRQKGGKLSIYFQNLSQSNNFGAELAKSFLAKSEEIATKLVSDGVAKNFDDINTILKNGFGHLYDANNAFREEVKL
ncbi:MAG: 3-hydroxyacyl-CoA dehydrogenase, partial [Chlamydiales bacterium]